MHTIYHTSFTFPKYYESNKKKFRQTCFRQNTFDFLNLSLYDDRRSQGSITGYLFLLIVSRSNFIVIIIATMLTFELLSTKIKKIIVLTKMFGTWLILEIFWILLPLMNRKILLFSILTLTSFPMSTYTLNFFITSSW